VRSLQGVSVAQVSCGCRHTLARTSQGAVWQWGALASSEGRNSGAPLQPTVVALPSAARHVQCAVWSDQMSAFAVVLLDGSAFVWGALASPYVKAPTRLTLPATVGMLKIVFGREHMLMLDFDGRVYSFGGNARGSLGTLLPVRQRSCLALHSGAVEFVPIAGLAGVRVVDICTGSHQSMALGDDGSVWHWGTCRPTQSDDGSATRLAHRYRQPTRLRCAVATTFSTIAATDSFLFVQPGAPRTAVSDTHIDAFRRRAAPAAAAVAAAAGAPPARRLDVSVDANQLPRVVVTWRRRASVPHWQAKSDRLVLLPNGFKLDGTVRSALPVLLPVKMDAMSERANADFDREDVVRCVADRSWSLERHMPRLGDDEGFFEFDVSQALNGLVPASYSCFVITQPDEDADAAVEHTVPAFSIAPTNALVSARLECRTTLDARQALQIAVRYVGAAIAYTAEHDSVVLYDVGADGVRGNRVTERTVPENHTVVFEDVFHTPGKYEIALERIMHRYHGPTFTLAAQSLTVVKPTRRVGVLSIEGEGRYRYLKKAPVTWDINAAFSNDPEERASDLSSAYIVVLPADVSEDDPDHTPVATLMLDGKAAGSGELYLTGDAGDYRAHVLLRTRYGVYFVASTPPFEIMTTVPRSAISVRIGNAVGDDGVVHVQFGSGVQVEWKIDSVYWNEYDAIVLVHDRADQSAPAGYQQLSTAVGSAVMNSLVGRFRLEYRAIGKSGQFSVPLPDLPPIVVEAAAPAPAPVAAPATPPTSSQRAPAAAMIRVHETVGKAGGVVHLSFTLPDSIKLSGMGDFIAAYDAASERVVTVTPIAYHRVDGRTGDKVPVHVMDKEGRFVWRLWLIDPAVGVVFGAQSDVFELTHDDSRLRTAAAAAPSPAAGGWHALFVAAGIEESDAQNYAALMEQHEFPIELMADLDRALLKDIGIDKVGHQVRILKEVAARK